MPHFLAFLPEKMSPNKEKAYLNATANAKMMMNDVTTGFAAETFAVFLYPRSEAATGIMANTKNYLTNDTQLGTLPFQSAPGLLFGQALP